ncbi:tetratricopeptide repeat protein [Saccharothrix luteola]|uniref:tetratricopeptide repeat protein n=1 Tax=Saccharothrix luteola TaxID=2893018 RepID=UPI001E2DAEB8|nr:tetratricopeptide repeat protein [Saccharothrix luteola]MCC8251459.1 tetratricopeptide repeat protein [Saccharothrix luteola]
MAEPQHVPARIGIEDVERLAAETERLRDVDYRRGGGACRDSAVECATRHDLLLDVAASGAVRERLLVALADLHNLAAWTCFDTGFEVAASRHWDRALGMAVEAGRHDLAANVHYRVGRMRLHGGRRREALKAFASGLHAARRAGSRRAVAMLRANQAWAHAGLGHKEEAMRLLALAQDEFARASDPAPGWARFFDETDLSGLTGVVLTDLARTVDPSRTTPAIDSLTTAVAGYSEAMTRSRAFSLMALAANHLVDGDFDHAAEVGGRALALAATIRSTRVADRLRPLRHLADRHPGNPHARALSARIGAFTPPV